MWTFFLYYMLVTGQIVVEKHGPFHHLEECLLVLHLVGTVTDESHVLMQCTYQDRGI